MKYLFYFLLVLLSKHIVVYTKSLDSFHTQNNNFQENELNKAKLDRNSTIDSDIAINKNQGLFLNENIDKYRNYNELNDVNIESNKNLSSKAKINIKQKVISDKTSDTKIVNRNNTVLIENIYNNSNPDRILSVKKISDDDSITSIVNGNIKTIKNKIANIIDQRYAYRGKLRNNKEWLLMFGIPKRLPPAAWCTSLEMPDEPINIPLDIANINELKTENTKSFVPQMFVAVPTPNNSDPLSRALWRSSGNNCKDEFVPQFFKPFGRRKNHIDAWVGSSHFDDCGTHRSETKNFVYFSNIFYLPGNSRAAIVTCACKKSDLGAPCIPSAQWEENTRAASFFHNEKYAFKLLKPFENFTKSIVSKNDTDFNDEWKTFNKNNVNNSTHLIAGGFIVNSAATTGENNQVVITTDNDRIILESYLYGDSDSIWPEKCEINCPGSQCNVSLINNFCPSQASFDFKIDSIKSKTLNDTSENDSSVSNFSTIPYSRVIFSFSTKGIFKNKDQPLPAEIVCRMQQLPKTEYENLNCLYGNFKTNENLDLSVKNVTNYWDDKIAQTDVENTLSVNLPNESGVESVKIVNEPNVLKRFRNNDSQAQKPPSTEIVDSFFSRMRQLYDILPSINKIMSNDIKNPENSVDEESDNNYKNDHVESYPRYTPTTVLSNLYGNLLGDMDISKKDAKDMLLKSNNLEVTMPNMMANAMYNRVDGTSGWKFGSPTGFVSITNSTPSIGASFQTGWGDSILKVNSAKSVDKIGVGFVKNNYGIDLTRIGANNSTSLDVFAGKVKSSSFVDLSDHEWGQRLKIGDFDIGVRHDFDDYLDPNDKDYATSINVFYKTVKLTTDLDIPDGKAATSFGINKYKFSVMSDFIDKETEFQGNWGNGWQLVLESDIEATKDDAARAKVGFGKKGYLYAASGFGVTLEDEREGSLEVEAKDLSTSIDFAEKGNDLKTKYKLKFGKYSYVWEAVVVPTNIKNVLSKSKDSP